MSAYDIYRESVVAGKLLTQQSFLAIATDKQKNTSNSGAYETYVHALKETDATITPLSRTDFFKKCIDNGGAYAGYFALANEFLKAATEKMTEAEVQSIYGQVMVLSESDYNTAVNGCSSTEDFAKKDIELINEVMTKVFAQNDSFNWTDLNFENIKYRAIEVFEATTGFSSGYSAYTETAASVDNNKSILSEDAWLETLKTPTSDGETTLNSIYKVMVSKGYTGSIDDFINAMKQKNGTVDAKGYAGANVQQDTDTTQNANTTSNSSTSNATYSSGSTSSGSNASTSTAQVINGKDGRGITSVAVNESGELLVTYSDNTTQNVGLVRTTAASPQLSSPLDAFVYTALGMAILSLLANGALAYAVYRVSRRRPKE